MLQLRAFVGPEQVDEVVGQLADVSGLSHLLAGGRTVGGMVMVTADLEASSADATLDILHRLGLAADDVTLWRATSVQPLGWRRRHKRRAVGDTAVWAEVLGHADEHARPNLLYLLFMVAAGVIASVGVLTASSILIVGAMAVSPDLLPISAAAIGLAERRWALGARAWATLGAGLLFATLAATGATLLLRLTDRIADDLDPSASTLGLSLTTIGPGTVLVAIAAGVAGMLAYESVGGVAVGVAISVTTIPAAAFFGAALALGDFALLDGAGAVLVVNVVIIVLAGAATVWVRRRVRPGEPR